MKSFYILAILLAFSSVSSLAQTSFAQDDEVQESTEADTASPDEESESDSDQDEEDSEEAVESTEANLKEKVFPVEWYQPELGVTDKKKRTRVIISGKTIPNSYVYVNSKVIPVVVKTKAGPKIKYLRTMSALATDVNEKTKKKARYVKSDGDGYYSLPLDLPNFNVQLPVKIRPPKKSEFKPKAFQLNLKVQAQQVEVANLKDLKINPFSKKDWALWFGVGYNFLQFEQASPTIQADLAYDSFKAPAIFFRLWNNLTDSFDINFEYKVSPGNVSSNEDLTVTSGSYDWSIITLEAEYSPKSWQNKTLLGFATDYAVKVGFQQHTVPFIRRVQDSPSQIAEIATNDILMATLGGQLNVKVGARWIYEVFMRYQLPMTNGDVFDLTSSFTFDGSVGAIYKLNRNWRIGGFWYGQSHSYDYEGHTDPVTSSETSGDMSLFFSNAELRLGYEW